MPKIDNVFHLIGIVPAKDRGKFFAMFIVFIDGTGTIMAKAQGNIGISGFIMSEQIKNLFHYHTADYTAFSGFVNSIIEILKKKPDPIWDPVFIRIMFNRQI